MLFIKTLHSSYLTNIRFIYNYNNFISYLTSNKVKTDSFA